MRKLYASISDLDAFWTKVQDVIEDHYEIPTGCACEFRISSGCNFTQHLTHEIRCATEMLWKITATLEVLNNEGKTEAGSTLRSAQASTL